MQKQEQKEHELELTQLISYVTKTETLNDFKFRSENIKIGLLKKLR